MSFVSEDRKHANDVAEVLEPFLKVLDDYVSDSAMCRVMTVIETEDGTFNVETPTPAREYTWLDRHYKKYSRYVTSDRMIIILESRKVNGFAVADYVRCP